MVLIKNKLSAIGLRLTGILVPGDGVDMEKWAVIACDQYTSDPEYWYDVEKTVGSAPSSLKLFLPEVYLDTPREKKISSSIFREMKGYLRSGVLKELDPGFIYIRRTTGYGNVRNGLLACVDLEMYSFEKGSASMIRPTEKTIVERIPPRVKIREKAVLELPHILFLIDDPGKTVVEPLEKTKNLYKKIYDFKLMKNGGRIEGYHITEDSALSSIANAISALADEDAFHETFGDDKPMLLYAVGDGNHSLASAKQHWENVKETLKPEEVDDHPARFALVEIVNIHDEGMKFEPIHRLLFDCSIDNLLASMDEEFDITKRDFDDAGTLEEFVKAEYDNKASHTFGIISDGSFLAVSVNSPDHNLAVATLQAFLDKFIDANDIEIDFIHDTASVVELSTDNNIGLLLPPIDKTGFFGTVIHEGTLPRKAFSMGHADEKRFYLEARKITK
jgi:uncharacterized protein (DUF1015 family)